MIRKTFRPGFCYLDWHGSFKKSLPLEEVRFTSLYIALLILFGSQVFAQQIEIIDFDKLKTEMNRDDDTLRVFNFWATWCKPCVEELPAFEKLHKNLSGKKVKVLLISMDFAEDLETRVKPFVLKKKIRSIVWLLDDIKYNKWIGKIDPDWGGAIPVTLFLRSSSNYRYFHEGSIDYSGLSEILDSQNL